MEIIFANRKNCLNERGGDTVQMLKTKEYLEKKYGDKINICLDSSDINKYPKAEIVHIFNIQTVEESLKYVEESKKANKKIVLSTIYWDLSEMVYMNRGTRIFRNLKLVRNLRRIDFLKKIISLENIFLRKKQKKLIESVDFLLPNSDEELKIISEKYKINIDELRKKSISVPNAVDIKLNSNINTNKEIKFKNYVLQVGRIELNKNQISVVEALYNHPEIPILFIGRKSEGVSNNIYIKKLYKISSERGNVHFINEINHEELAVYYKNALVHILPSFRESPGLVSLEALFYGTEIVVSNEKYCPIKFYKFNEIAHICDPYSIKSIEIAILTAIKEKRNNKIGNEYFSYFSYEQVALKTREVYEKLKEIKE